MQSAYSIPMLTAEEEHDLATSLYNENDLQAAQQLIMSHLRFVIHIAKGYSGYGLAQADLVQEGNVGLMKAVKRFNPEVGVRLVSFAVHWIKAEIHDYILKNWKLVKVATTKAQRKLFFNLRKNKQASGLVDGPEAKRIATLLDVSEADVIEMDQRLSRPDQSFEKRDDEDYAAPEMYLQSDSLDPLEIVADLEAEVTDAGDLRQALKQLDDRSRQIVQGRWLGDEKLGLKVFAERFGISIERVRQLESQALKKLKHNMVA
jgi:RNA polymerase sigma-32 factor